MPTSGRGPQNSVRTSELPRDPSVESGGSEVRLTDAGAAAGAFQRGRNAPFNWVTRARSGWYASANSAAREVGGELVDGLGGVGRKAVEDAGPALGQPREAGEPQPRDLGRAASPGDVARAVSHRRV